MRTSSPLRYPGGKASMTSLLSGIRSINQLGDRAVAEPFAGGAGASLSLLYLEDTHEIHINDIDPAIHDFWWTVVNRPRPFLAMLRSTHVSIAEWRRQRETYRCSSGVSRLRRGFAAFYLNRCNRSGIIMNGGPIGGIDQAGTWKLDARFNKSELEVRCKRVAEYSQRIRVSQMDALDFIYGCDQKNTFFFIDPPYYAKGGTLYLNKLDHAYHKRLADLLRCLEDTAWVLTYDDCPEIRGMYAGWASIRPFSLRYAASERRRGREILITPRWMHLPEEQASTTIEWPPVKNEEI
ncbi:MAG: DNA adenine methylase [Smithellaceae bacterium]|nr:DNA adenine methylase [Smithellaceae bacterium]